MGTLICALIVPTFSVAFSGRPLPIYGRGRSRSKAIRSPILPACQLLRSHDAAVASEADEFDVRGGGDGLIWSPGHGGGGDIALSAGLRRYAGMDSRGS